MQARSPASALAGQRGFALVSAVFLLIILAALGGFMVQFSTVQQATSTQDLLGSRAYQAARAGLERGLYQALRSPMPAICPPSTTLPALAGNLAGFNVVVACRQDNFIEGVNAVAVFQITATATSGVAGTPSFVSRRLTATVSR